MLRIRNFIPIFILFIISCESNNESDEVVYKPIGVFKTEFSTSTEVPRQGILLPDVKAKIVLSSDYGEALLDLDKFEYIWVIYHMNLVKDWDPFVNPPGTEHYFGTFATRSPRRPNPIAIALVKLDGIDHDTLFVSGIDAFNNTPVLDLKPYLPSIDYVKSEVNESMEREMGHHDEVMIEEDKPVYK
jgi:tRNA-Thr(GGU) m(6)t(6)A37 methyltransferase TsaA